MTGMTDRHDWCANARGGQSLRLLVVMTARSWVASTELAVPLRIEAHHGRLRGDPAVFEPRSPDRSDDVFPPLKIGRLKHHLVVSDIKMAVQKRDTEAVETIVFRKHNPYLFQALGISIIDRPDVTDVVELAPLHCFQNYCIHPNASSLILRIICV
jgi:hypothetical protein